MRNTQKSKNIVMRLFGILFLAIALGNTDLIAQTKIVNPRINGRVEPVGLNEDRIAFSWNLDDPTPDTTQIGYRIMVQANRSDEILWDSNWINSVQCVEIPYAGKKLKSSTPYRWIVETKNNRGKLSRLEKPATFTTGILQSGDWKAKWISMERTDKDPAPMFRKTFEIDPNKKIENATVHICGLGHFELNLNGEKVGNNFIDPGWTNYRKTCLYVSFDLTDSLKSGENVFGVLLGNGMYNVVGGRYVKFTGSFGPPKMICQFHVKYTDGTEQLVCSDDSWKAALGPITFSCVYGGEDVDNRRIENWIPAIIVDGPGGKLQVQEAPPITVAETKKPESLKRLPDGRYVADFGYNFSGRPRIVFKGKSGQKATVKTAEIVDKIWDGHSYTLTLRGDGEELLLPKFTYFGFQFLYIEGAVLEKDRTETDAEKPTIVSVEADFTTSSAEKVGAFECSNELINDIDAMIDRSVRSNLASVLTDCPHREKLGWLEVPHLMGPSIMGRYNVHNLYRKICQDMTEAQLDNGHVPDIVPEYTRFQDGFFHSPEWGSASVQIPWLLHTIYGDTDILHRQAKTMSRYVDYLNSTRDEKGLVKPGLGDWYDWSEEKGHAGYSQHTPRELTATAIFIDDAQKMGTLACRIGPYKSDSVSKDRSEYLKLHREASKNFFDAYCDRETGKVVPNSQSAIAESLFVLKYRSPESYNDQERRWIYPKKPLEQLVTRIEADHYKPTVGEVSFVRLVRALAVGDRNDVLWKMIHRIDKPGYGYMLRERGMKTLSETWDGPGSSMNHCMFGHAQEWFTGTIVGINLLETQSFVDSRNDVPCSFKLTPTPVGDLTWAKGHYDSVYGRVESSWKIEDGKFKYRCVIPANTRADIYIPTVQSDSIRINGKAAHNAKYGSSNRTAIQLGSGTYEIEHDWIAP